MHDSYLVTADERHFVLRVYNHKYRSLEEILEEVSILLLLKEKGIGFAYPVKNREGMFVLNVYAPEG